MEMWTRYRVTWSGLTALCGSVPADPEIVKAWLAARKPRVRPPGGKSLDEVQQEVLDSLERDEEFDEAACNILTFQRHEGRACMRAATIKAHLKDCAGVLSGMLGRQIGERALSTRAKNDVYPDEAVYWVPILREDGTPVTKHDGERDKPIHPRFGVSALKRFEWIEPWRLDFTLKVLTVKGASRLTQDNLEMLMQYGGVHGYAGERSDGMGQYIATITREE